MSERVVAAFALQVLAPSETAAEEGSAFSLEQQERRVLANLPAMLESVEQDLDDILPAGFFVRIATWDEEAR